MTNIDDFIRKEELKMTWLDKITMNYPKISSTILLAGSLENMHLGKRNVIKPSIGDKAMSIVLILFAGLFWLLFLKMLLEYRFPFLFFIFAFLFLTFIIYLLINNSFFNKKYIYTITIDKGGISIDSNMFYWTEIAETYIMSRQTGRSTNYYLLIFNKDATVKKLDLFKFGITDTKLAAIIEYYRTDRNNFTV